MNPAPSRLLSQLDARITATSDPFAADCLRAERACYLARQGHFNEVNAVLLDLRRRYELSPHAAISSWLNMAEGLLSHFSNMGSLARDKFRRAFAMSAAAGLRPLHALSAAWLANMDYHQEDIVSMVRHVAQSLQLADGAHHSARSRANLVVAHAYHLAGRLDLALPWYACARRHASAEGDDATIGALMHNMTWLRAANARQAMFTGVGNAYSRAGEHALIGAESTWNFEQLVDRNG